MPPVSIPIVFTSCLCMYRGIYKVAYVDGCFKNNNGHPWMIHSIQEWFLVDSNGTKLFGLPGSVGEVNGIYLMGNGSFTTYPECVAYNLQNTKPSLFNFTTGGVLGIKLFDDPYVDNVKGDKTPT